MRCTDGYYTSRHIARRVARFYANEAGATDVVIRDDGGRWAVVYSRATPVADWHDPLYRQPPKEISTHVT